MTTFEQLAERLKQIKCKEWEGLQDLLKVKRSLHEALQKGEISREEGLWLRKQFSLLCE